MLHKGNMDNVRNRLQNGRRAFTACQLDKGFLSRIWKNINQTRNLIKQINKKKTVASREKWTKYINRQSISE